MKYSFIIPYFKRINLLNETLRSFIFFYKFRKDFNIIIIEDYKNIINTIEHNLLINTIKNISELNILHLQRPKEIIYNCSPHFNQGVKNSDADFIILTNPECKHTTNILEGLDDNFNINQSYYIVCACKLPKNNPYQYTWYQHSFYNNRMLHFCSALSKKNFISIGGFDENYSNGICFEDNDFLKKIQKQKLPILTKDDLIVEHQWHDPINYDDNKIKNLWEKNKSYYYKKWGECP